MLRKYINIDELELKKGSVLSAVLQQSCALGILIKQKQIPVCVRVIVAFVHPSIPRVYIRDFAGQDMQRLKRDKLLRPISQTENRRHQF